MANLRDQGYPSSSTTRRRPGLQPRVSNYVQGSGEVNKSEIPSGYQQSYPKINADQLMDDNATAYAEALNKALNVSKAPINVEGRTVLFEPDYNWGKWTDTTYTARTPQGTRLGFANHYHDFNPSGVNGYSAGIDNLYGLGEDYISKEFNLPLGVTASMEYDGDGTLSGNLEVPQRNYYIQALANLLRGQR